MRKAINGLSIIVAEQMEHDPLCGALYVFCNRDRRILKSLWWDRNGFWLLEKRLERDRFPWPVSVEAVREITAVMSVNYLSRSPYFFATATSARTTRCNAMVVTPRLECAERPDGRPSTTRRIDWFE